MSDGFVWDWQDGRLSVPHNSQTSIQVTLGQTQETAQEARLVSMDRSTTISVIRGMVLSEAAAMTHGEAVHTEVMENADSGGLTLRVFVGQRSAVIEFTTPDAENVLSDAAARRTVEARIRDALEGLEGSQ